MHRESAAPYLAAGATFLNGTPYLVGARGEARHAVSLGAIVTVTHTIGVFALGVITLALSQYVLPEDLYPWLNLVSGLLVLVVGALVLRARLRGVPEGHTHGPGGHTHGPGGHTHGPGGHARSHVDHEHAHPDDGAGRNRHDQSPGHDHAHGRDHAHDPVPDHGHDHDEHHHAYAHGRERARNHDHAPNHDHAHDYDHAHDNDHDHAHDQVEHDHAADSLRPRVLLAAGASAGLIPCPSALVVLLAAVAQQKIALGLLLIVTFSLGLAATLTGLGLMVVYARTLTRYTQMLWMGLRTKTAYLPG